MVNNLQSTVTSIIVSVNRRLLYLYFDRFLHRPTLFSQLWMSEQEADQYVKLLPELVPEALNLFCHGLGQESQNHYKWEIEHIRRTDTSETTVDIETCLGSVRLSSQTCLLWEQDIYRGVAVDSFYDQLYQRS